jgi:hypothetical protein
MSLFDRVYWSRRDVLKKSGMLSAAAAMAPISASAATLVDASPLPGADEKSGDNLYTRIGRCLK